MFVAHAASVRSTRTGKDMLGPFAWIGISLVLAIMLAGACWEIFGKRRPDK